MPRTKPRITIREVARRAGVSVATVSRTLNNSPLVDRATGDHVRSIAQHLRYVPNASARSLSMRRTETIGLILPDMHGEFFSEIIRGADAEARSHHYHLLVSSSHSNREELENAIGILHGRTDGLIVMSPHLVEVKTLLHHARSSLPVVLIGPQTPIEGIDTIRVDNEGGARQVGRHLIELGHRRIAVIGGPRGNIDAAARSAGFKTALEEAGISMKPQWMLNGDFTDSGGYEIARRILACSPRPTAVFASNDSMAIGLLRAFLEHRISIPGEMSVVGFDDIEIASYMHPSLTTVHVDISQLGSIAVRSLLESRNGQHRSMERHVLLSAQLVVRESTGPVGIS
jgi:LacI family transcriptional regulator